MMEPAAFGASVLFGRYTGNFRETVEQLLERGGAREVADAAQLTAALLEDLDDPETAAERGAAGRAFVLRKTAPRTGRSPRSTASSRPRPKSRLDRHYRPQKATWNGKSRCVCLRGYATLMTLRGGLSESTETGEHHDRPRTGSDPRDTPDATTDRGGGRRFRDVTVLLELNASVC